MCCFRLSFIFSFFPPCVLFLIVIHLACFHVCYIILSFIWLVFMCTISDCHSFGLFSCVVFQIIIHLVCFHVCFFKLSFIWLVFMCAISDCHSFGLFSCVLFQIVVHLTSFYVCYFRLSVFVCFRLSVCIGWSMVMLI